MDTEIGLQELFSDSEKILRSIIEGEPVVITDNGIPVMELVPLQHKRFIDGQVAKDAFASVPDINLDTLRVDLDTFSDPNYKPRR